MVRQRWLRRVRLRRPAGGLGWHLAVPLVVAVAGLLAVTSAVSSRGTDLRGGRYTDVPSLIASQRRQLADLRRQETQLQQDVSALRREVDSVDPTDLQKQSTKLVTPAGLTALRGPGLTVALDDAPTGEPTPPNTDPNTLVVHQQDLQAVINALWSGGAEGISLQGQRIISTTGIKCVGNAVVLQGVPYAPPYRIVAVGNLAAMTTALQQSKAVQSYLAYTVKPYNLGWSQSNSMTTEVPAYAGSVTMSEAKPIN